MSHALTFALIKRHKRPCPGHHCILNHSFKNENSNSLARVKLNGLLIRDKDVSFTIVRHQDLSC